MNKKKKSRYFAIFRLSSIFLFLFFNIDSLVTKLKNNNIHGPDPGRNEQKAQKVKDNRCPSSLASYSLHAYL
jgi:hypothetical protein